MRKGKTSQSCNGVVGFQYGKRLIWFPVSHHMWNHCQVDYSPKCERETTKVLEVNL